MTYDKDILESLRTRKYSLSEAKEIQSRRNARRERYDDSATSEAQSLIHARFMSIQRPRKYRKPALNIANKLKVSKNNAKTGGKKGISMEMAPGVNDSFEF